MKAKYGLRALLYLAKQPNLQTPVLISELARNEHIPRKFLEAILLELKNNGILQSRKGKGGGYFLRKKPEAIRLGRVVRALDGPLAPVPCVSQTAYAPCDECEDEESCGIRLIMKDVRDAMADVLDNATLAEMLRRIHRSGSSTSGAPMYHI